jgi:hypothetical protein
MCYFDALVTPDKKWSTCPRLIWLSQRYVPNQLRDLNMNIYRGLAVLGEEPGGAAFCRIPAPLGTSFGNQGAAFAHPPTGNTD